MRILLALMLMTAASVAAETDHLVGPEVRDARLQEQRRLRMQDLAVVDRLLESPRAARAAARIGADLGRTRAGLAKLSAVELRELAERAKALEGDPAAGMSSGTRDILVVALIVLIVLLVLKAV